MKKIIVLLFVALFSGSVVKANDINVAGYLDHESVRMYFNGNDSAKDYNFVISKRQLGNYLGLDDSDTT